MADTSASRSAAGTPATGSTRQHAIYRGVLIWILLSMGLLSAWRGAHLKFDFSHFYLDAAFVWQHGVLNPDFTNEDPHLRRQLPFYLPVVSLALAPLAAGGAVPGAITWAAIHVLCFAYCLRVLLRHAITGAVPKEQRDAQPQSSATTALSPATANAARSPGLGLALAACLIALPALYEATKFNQLSFITLALVLGGVVAVADKHPLRAGLLFACATVLKLLPGIMLVWLLLKRQWTAAAALLIFSAAITILPCLFVFGVNDTVHYYREWIKFNVEGAPSRGLVDDTLDDHFVDRRNQSIEVVLARWFIPSHRFHIDASPIALDEHTCTTIARGIKGALLLGLLVAARRPISRLSNRAFWCEASVFILGMLVFSPLLRQYYLIWALPTVALLLTTAIAPEPSRARPLARIGLAVWLAGMAAWAYEPLRTGGVHLFMLVAISVVLLRLAWLESTAAISFPEQALARLHPPSSTHPPSSAPASPENRPVGQA